MEEEKTNAPRKVELVWEGKKTDVERVSLPFQRIEIVNESRATREAQRDSFLKQFQNDEGGWHNRLIWGDNKYVLHSLLDEFAGKLDLVYIDPPFATGQDFSLQIEIGGQKLLKEPSLIEEKAYRDTWGNGLTSYLQMMEERLILIRQLLSDEGSLYVHCDYHVSHYLKLLLDGIFGIDRLGGEIIWKRKDAQSYAAGYGVVHDTLLYYTKSDFPVFNKVYTPLSTETADNWYNNEEIAEKDTINRIGTSIKKGTLRRFNKADVSAPGDRTGTEAHYKWKNVWPPSGRHWAYRKEIMSQLDEESGLVYSTSGRPYEKRYLDESKGTPLQTLWDDIDMIRGMSKHSKESEWCGYATQKPVALTNRIIEVSSKEGSLVGDFFCGSGTMLISAEKMNRRWIGCDIGRWAVQVTRKRLLDIKNCRPFEVLNLGKYERQYWQGITFTNKKDSNQTALHEYIKFILDLYKAEPITGMVHIHGQRGGRMVHVGAVDAPVTLSEMRDAITECTKIKQTKLDILGWEWEMGLHDVEESEARKNGINLRLVHIPREAMDSRAVEAGDIHFYELAYLEVDPEIKGRAARLKLKNFVIPSPELIPDEVRSKIRKWSDYIDYWAIDYEFKDDIFHNQWQDYRTREKRDLDLVSDWHDYETSGEHHILVKVFDIFGNDTTHMLELKLR